MKFLLALALVACSPMHYAHGVPNLAQVDENVYRSGQITSKEGLDYIEQLAHGRRIHIIKLNFDSEGSDLAAVQRGWDVHVFAIQPEGDQDLWDDLLSVFKGPDPAIVADIDDLLLDAVTRSNSDFYLVHCTHGQDRTGYIIGRHRVLHDGWSKKAAWEEMLAHHFHPELHGIHEAWESFAPGEH